jgi:tRNA1(Val) A37 N6-methylase TrmN6
MEVTLEDLHIGDLKIYQNAEGFRFGTDSVLLAWFARRKKFSFAADLCSGNGIIPLLLSVAPHNKIVGAEILEEQSLLFDRSIKLNDLQDHIFSVNADIREISPKCPDKFEHLIPSGFDLVTVNPPYFDPSRGITAEGMKKGARSETDCTLADAVVAAKHLLKHGGRLCMVHKPERLADIFETFRLNNIEPKELLPVISVVGKKPEIILIEGRKGGGKELTMHPPLYITDKDGLYTPEICSIYGFDRNER